MDGRTYSKDDIIWYRIQFEEGDPYEWHVDGELKHNIAVVFDLKGGTLNDSADPLVTYSLQKYGVITDNLIPSLDGSGFSGWRVVDSMDADFKANQLYQAADINNHEFTGIERLNIKIVEGSQLYAGLKSGAHRRSARARAHRRSFRGWYLKKRTLPSYGWRWIFS